MTCALAVRLLVVADFFESSPWARSKDIPTQLQHACGTFTQQDPNAGYWDDLVTVEGALAAVANCDVRALEERLVIAFDRCELANLIRNAASLIEKDPTDR